MRQRLSPLCTMEKKYLKRRLNILEPAKFVLHWPATYSAIWAELRRVACLSEPMDLKPTAWREEPTGTIKLVA